VSFSGYVNGHACRRSSSNNSNNNNHNYNRDEDVNEFAGNALYEVTKKQAGSRSSIGTIIHTYIHTCMHTYRGADKSLARPTSRYILFHGENISFDASLYIYIYIYSTNIHPIMIINRIYEHRNLLSLQLVSFLVGLRTYQHPCTYVYMHTYVHTYIHTYKNTHTYIHM